MLNEKLKRAIANYYESGDKDAFHNIKNEVVSYLLDHGFQVKDIDFLMVGILKNADGTKFKYYYIKKNNYKVNCGICGTNEGLQLHHLKSASRHPELKYNLDNVALLCYKCHYLLHEGGGSSKLDVKNRNKIREVFKSKLRQNLQK